MSKRVESVEITFENLESPDDRSSLAKCFTIETLESLSLELHIKYQ